jgi:hypothetical protein
MDSCENWIGAWMLVDTRNKSYPIIEQEIFRPRTSSLAPDLAGSVLGYPVLSMDGPFEKRYIYIDKTATCDLATLTGSMVDNVIGIDYVAPAGLQQDEESWGHF